MTAVMNLTNNLFMLLFTLLFIIVLLNYVLLLQYQIQ